MTIYEVLSSYREDLQNIFELYDGRYNRSEIRLSLIRQIEIFFRLEELPISIIDITDDEIMQSGHILFKFKHFITNEEYIQKF